jgi:hypothetical protein
MSDAEPPRNDNFHGASDFTGVNGDGVGHATLTSDSKVDLAYSYRMYQSLPNSDPGSVGPSISELFDGDYYL